MQPELTYPDNVIPPLRFQFCPMCKTQLVREVIFDDNIPRVRCPNCEWIQLSSNVVGVSVIAANDQGIAVILPPNEDGVGLPAGLVEYGEDPEIAAVREVLEETGLEIEIVDCLGWYYSERTTWPGPVVQIIYEARIIGGALKGSDEGEAKLFPAHEFPSISSRRTGSRKAMALYFSKTNQTQ